MNITLSAEESLIRRTRDYARNHGTSLNRLVRDYLDSLTRTGNREAAAAEFRRLAMGQAGRSPAGYRFHREEAHDRSQRR